MGSMCLNQVIWLVGTHVIPTGRTYVWSLDHVLHTQVWCWGVNIANSNASNRDHEPLFQQPFRMWVKNLHAISGWSFLFEDTFPHKSVLRTANIAKTLCYQRINKQKMPVQSTVSDEDFGEDYDSWNPPQESIYSWFQLHVFCGHTRVHSNKPMYRQHIRMLPLSHLLSPQNPEESNSVNMSESTNSFTIPYKLLQLDALHTVKHSLLKIHWTYLPFLVLHQPLHVEWYFFQLHCTM